MCTYNNNNKIYEEKKYAAVTNKNGVPPIQMHFEKYQMAIKCS